MSLKKGKKKFKTQVLEMFYENKDISFDILLLFKFKKKRSSFGGRGAELCGHTPFLPLLLLIDLS